MINGWLKYLVLGIALLLLFIGTIFLVDFKDNPSTTVISESNKLFDYTLEIAANDSDRIRGLSGRQSLPLNHGLLFIFEEIGNHGIWMKDMNFPIDIIWLNGERQIVGLATDVQPESYPETFYAPQPSILIIEVNAGDVLRQGLKIGDSLQLPVDIEAQIPAY